MKIAEMKALYIKASKAYYNSGKLVMTDAEFDTLEKKIKKLDPEWDQLKKTGVKVDKKVEVDLEFFMPSLHKGYPETIGKWVIKQIKKALVWSHKLDGNSIQGTYSGGRWTKLVTRGDGTRGGDISFLIPYLNLPKLRASSGGYVFRFEAIMKSATFDAKWSRKAKGDKGFDNARNLVSGALNSKKPHACLKDVDFVVLGVYNMDYLQGLKWAEDQGMDVVRHNGIKNLSAQDLVDRLRSERAKSEYEIDGLVLMPHDQYFQYDNNDKPKHSIAFKINEAADVTETVVEEVVWQLSRTGRWTPKIRVKPVKLKGVTVTYATAHNAEWMISRGINVGAVVGIVRSGDVIPKIETVVKTGKGISYPPGKFIMKGVHYFAVGQNKDADVRGIHHFFATLGIDHIAEKTCAKLYDAGLATVKDFMSVHKSRLKAYAELLGDGMRNKIANEMRRVLDDEGVSLIKIMNASNCFESFGERRLQMIQDHFAAKGESDILRSYVCMPAKRLQSKDVQTEILMIRGFKDATTRQFFEGLAAFRTWFRAVQAEHSIKINKPVVKAKKAKAGAFANQFVSWTGYRSADQEAAVEQGGGEVIKLGAKTTILFYNPKGKFMDKVEAARAKGIEVRVWS